MSEPIRMSKDFGDGMDRLLLNPSGSLVGVFTYERKVYNRRTLAVYAADGRRVGGPLQLGDSRDVEFLDDDTLLIAHEREVLRWQPTAEPERVLTSPDFLYSLGVSAARGLVVQVVGSQPLNSPSVIVVVNLRTGEGRWTARAPFSLWVNGVAFTPRGRFVLAELGEIKGDERALLLYEADTGRLAQTFYGSCGLWNVAFAPNEEWFVAPAEWDAGNVLNVYELGCGAPVRTLQLPDGVTRPAALSVAPDGPWVESIDWTGGRVRLDPATGAVLARFEPAVTLRESSPVVVSASGRVAAGVAEDNTIAIWPLDDGEPKKPARKPKK